MNPIGLSDDAPFQIFGTPHLIALGLLATAILYLPIVRKTWSTRAKDSLRYFLLAWLFFWEAAFHIWNLYYGAWSYTEHLPLHICSLFAWLSIVMLATKSYSIYELAYFAGIGGASQAMLTPDTGAGIASQFRIVQIFASHSGIILASLFMTFVEGYRPTVKSLKRIIICANIYLAFIFVLNLVMGSNYLFIGYKPTTFYSLLDYLAPWPWYILELEVIGITVFLLLYLPFLVKDQWVKRRPPA